MPYSYGIRAQGTLHGWVREPIELRDPLLYPTLNGARAIAEYWNRTLPHAFVQYEAAEYKT